MGMAKETLSSLRQLCAREWRALLVLVLANVVYAFAVAYCTLPYRFPDIGVPGIAVLTNYLFGLSPNWMIVGVNLMLIYWGRRDLGLHFLALTVFSVAVFSGFLAVFSRFPFSITEDKFMAAVISGFLKGVSMGAMFNVGGSSGGFDIAAAVLRRRYDLEVGRFSIIYNVVILAFSLGVVGLESVVYGVVSVYICGVMLDNMTRNFDKRKQALIITNIPDEVSRFITATASTGGASTRASPVRCSSPFWGRARWRTSSASSRRRTPMLSFPSATPRRCWGRASRTGAPCSRDAAASRGL